MAKTVTVTIRGRWRRPRLDRLLRSAALLAVRGSPLLAVFLFNLGHRLDVFIGSERVGTRRIRAVLTTTNTIQFLTERG